MIDGPTARLAYGRFAFRAEEFAVGVGSSASVYIADESSLIATQPIDSLILARDPGSSPRVDIEGPRSLWEHVGMSMATDGGRSAILELGARALLQITRSEMMVVAARVTAALYSATPTAHKEYLGGLLQINPAGLVAGDVTIFSPSGVINRGLLDVVSTLGIHAPASARLSIVGLFEQPNVPTNPTSTGLLLVSATDDAGELQSTWLEVHGAATLAGGVAVCVDPGSDFNPQIAEASNVTAPCMSLRTTDSSCRPSIRSACSR